MKPTHFDRFPDYVPNLKDPRVVRRMKIAYVFAVSCLKVDEPKGSSAVSMIKQFGRNDQPLGNWLRKKLIICTNSHFSPIEKTCKQFVRNQDGADEVRSILMAHKNGINLLENAEDFVSDDDINGVFGSREELFDACVIRENMLREYGDELETGNFVYTDKSNRSWHSIQNINTSHREKLMAEQGYRFNYDVVACAPTLLCQFAEKHGWLRYDEDTGEFGALGNYIQDRNVLRTHIAQVADLDSKQAKVLINALFCSARLGANKEFALFHLLDCDPNKIQQLRGDDELNGLRKDIKSMWKSIEPSLTRIEYKDKNGKTRKKPLSSKLKWSCYFRLENLVMREVRSYLNDNGIKFFLEHDGWRSTSKVDTDDLTAFVEWKTGFRIKFDEQIQ